MHVNHCANRRISQSLYRLRHMDSPKQLPNRTSEVLHCLSSLSSASFQFPSTWFVWLSGSFWSTCFVWLSGSFWSTWFVWLSGSFWPTQFSVRFTTL